MQTKYYLIISFNCFAYQCWAQCVTVLMQIMYFTAMAEAFS